MTDAGEPLKAFERLRPVFIGGLYRSGTTLLLRLLEGCPELLTYPVENKFVYQYLKLQLNDRSGRLHPFEALRNSGSPAEIFDYLKTFSAGRRLEPSKRDSRYPVERNLALKEELAEDMFDQDFENCFLDFFSKVSDPRNITSLFKIWIAAYFSKKAADHFAAKSAWVVKYPDGAVCYEKYRKAFPGSKMIYMVRDPRGCYASMKKHGEILPALAFFSFPQRKIKFFERFLNFYAQARRKIEAAARKDPGVMIVHYEELVKKPREVMRRVAGFIGISYSEKLLQPVFFGSPWIGNSSYENPDKAPRMIDVQSVEQWKNTLAWYEKTILKILFWRYTMKDQDAFSS